MKKAAGLETDEEKENRESSESKPAGSGEKSSSRLVTSDGTYASQSAFSMTQTKKVRRILAQF